jgi:hypothetical protein
MKINSRKKQRLEFLPKNWCQMVRIALESKGDSLSEKKISQLKSGYLKNLELRKKVLVEIKALQKSHKKQLQELNKVVK